MKWKVTEDILYKDPKLRVPKNMPWRDKMRLIEGLHSNQYVEVVE
jgi:hypothetical protein